VKVALGDQSRMNTPRSAYPGARADWLRDGRLRHGLRAYGPRLLGPLCSSDRRFAILTTGRAGSELLVSLLASHPRIACDGEILALRRMAPLQLVEARSALAAARGARAYGFKLLRSHLVLQGARVPASGVSALRRRGFRIVGLERRDLLQQAISFLTAADAGYHHRRGDGAVHAPAVVDPAAVIATMYLLEEAVAFGREVLADGELALVYEDDLADPGPQQRTVDRICEMLGLRRHPVRSELVRLSPRRTEQLVQNHEELARALDGTRFAAYLPAGGI
jgi:LPS sulfotransferase NodH